MPFPGYQRAFAWLMAHGNTACEHWMAERKRRLLGALSGVLVEVGPGALPMSHTTRLGCG
jgi:hypothetical protein